MRSRLGKRLADAGTVNAVERMVFCFERLRWGPSPSTPPLLRLNELDCCLAEILPLPPARSWTRCRMLQALKKKPRTGRPWAFSSVRLYYLVSHFII